MRPSARAVAPHPPPGALRAGLLAARDEHPPGLKLAQGLVRRAGLKATVEGYLARAEPEPLQLGDGLGQQHVLLRVARRGRRRRDQAARPAAGVLGHLRQLDHVPELVRLAEFALADRARVGVRERDDPIRDRLALGTPLDLPGDLRAAVGELLEPSRGPQPRARPRPRAVRLAAAASLRASPTDRSSSSPVSAVSLSTSALASPERRRIVRVIARSRRPNARERSRTRAL